MKKKKMKHNIITVGYETQAQTTWWELARGCGKTAPF